MVRGGPDVVKGHGEDDDPRYDESYRQPDEEIAGEGVSGVDWPLQAEQVRREQDGGEDGPEQLRCSTT